MSHKKINSAPAAISSTTDSHSILMINEKISPISRIETGIRHHRSLLLYCLSIAAKSSCVYTGIPPSNTEVIIHEARLFVEHLTVLD